MQTSLTLDEVSRLTGIPANTLRTRLNRGELSGVKIPFGKRMVWGLLPDVVTSLQEEGRVADEYEFLLSAWKEEMQVGKNRPEPIKQTTIERYCYGIQAFWDCLHGGEKPKDRKCLLEWRQAQERSICRFTLTNIAKAIVATDKPATRFNIYESTRVFYQFLVDRNLRSETDILRFKKFKPAKNKRPKRTHVKDKASFQDLVIANQAWYNGRSKYDRLLTDILLKTLWHTGARNTELCTLTRRAVDFREQVITLIGKGDKERQVGIHPDLLEPLQAYDKKRPPCSHRYFFAQENGAPLNRRIIWDRIRDVATKIGIDLTPHGLRRTFITRHLIEGAPTTLIQRIVGHERLETTNLYNMSDAQDALDLLRKPAKTPTVTTEEEEDEWDF